MRRLQKQNKRIGFEAEKYFFLLGEKLKEYCFLNQNFFVLEFEMEKELQTKNSDMEKEQLRSKLKNLEELVQRYKEEEDDRNKRAQAMFKEMFKPSTVLNTLK